MEPINQYAADRMAATFKGLGDPTRIQVLSVLIQGECSVNDLANAVSVSQSAVSHQLRLLRTLGFVSARREGQKIYYRIDDEHIGDLYSRAYEHISHVDARGNRYEA